MPTVAPGVHTLPAPTWVQSDNNLLPKWLRYLEWHNTHYGDDEIVRLQNAVKRSREYVESYIRYVKEYGDYVKKYQDELKLLQQRPVTDDEITTHYEAVLTSPHVIGTRIDSWGNLVVLVDPVIPGAEGLELGVYEIDFRSYKADMFRLTYGISYQLKRAFQRVGIYTYPASDSFPDGVEVQLPTNDKVTTALSRCDLEPMIATIVDHLTEVLKYTDKEAFDQKADNRVEVLPWQGLQVTDPVKALKRLSEAVATPIEQRIATLEENIRLYKNYTKQYQDGLRDYRKELRENEAALAKAEAARKNVKVIDEAEAARSLHFITSIPGVIAIRFTPNNTPVLHVRNSYVYHGKRYDLGDFELTLRTEDTPFGTVMDVKRTRVPLGGTYEAGWHTYAHAFCFGSRNNEILNAFYAGDLAHAVNLAVGTMNIIQEGTRIEGDFAEISMDALWVNRRRKRPRRTRRTVPVETPQTPAPRRGRLTDRRLRALGKAAIAATAQG